MLTLEHISAIIYALYIRGYMIIKLNIKQPTPTITSARVIPTEPVPVVKDEDELSDSAFGLIGGDPEVTPATHIESNSGVFDYELASIKDTTLRAFTEEVLTKVPKYFYSVPASMSGNFHPAQTRCEGGLVIHTKATIRVLFSIARNSLLLTKLIGKPELTQSDLDICVSAIILHDIVKYGTTDVAGKYDVGHHASAMEFINKVIDFDKYKEALTMIDVVLGCIYMHMGPWGKYPDGFNLNDSFKGLPILVEMSDYISSLKIWEN